MRYDVTFHLHCEAQSFLFASIRSCDAAIEMESFVEWVKNEGGHIHDGIDLFCPSSRRGDRCVTAKRDIEKGELLIRIPKSLTLHLCEDFFDLQSSNSDGQNDSLWLQKIKECIDSKDLSPFLAAVLLFVGEERKGKASRFWPYFELLPEKPPPSLFMWPQKELVLLKGGFLFMKTKNVIHRNKFGKERRSRAFRKGISQSTPTFCFSTSRNLQRRRFHL